MSFPFKPLPVSMPSVLALAIASATTSSVALAADEAKAKKIIEEVIVTTERRSQSLQDVAATVQAFSAEDLKAYGLNNDFRNLQNAVTGLHISNQEGKLEVYLRGVGNSDSDFASDPSVATHYNGVYLPRPRSIGPMFFDVERVEVNKGPQGTLRGRNATGGSINIISKRPDTDEFSGSVKVGAGRYDQQNIEAVVNVPVTDTLAVRAAVYTEERDTYMKNALAGSDLSSSSISEGALTRLMNSTGGSLEAPGALDDEAIRISATWDPTDEFSAFVMYDSVKQRGSGTPGAFTGRALSAGYDIDDLSDPYSQYFVNSGEMKNDIRGFSTNLAYDFGGVTLEYNGSWREYDFQHRNAAREWQIGMDYPGAREEAEGVLFGNNATAYGNFVQGETSETMVHEVRLVSSGDGPLQWTAGAFMMEEDFSWASQDFSHGWWGDCDWFQDGTVCGWLNGLSGENRNDDSTVESTAFFADGTFAVNDQLRLKGGIRWTEDDKTANEANANYQLVLTDEALASLGLAGPEDIVMATDGLQLVEAGDRPNNLVPIGNSSATRDYFLQGIQSWGANDNIDDLIAYDPNLFQVVINSDFDDGTGVGNISKSYSEDYVDWRIGAEYDINDDHMVYGTISTGTRSGGVNRPLPGALGASVNWSPEELTVWEAGSKYAFVAGEFPVRLNTAIFYYDYSEKVLQGLVSVTTPCNTNPTGFCTDNYVQNQNAAEASILGFEVDGDVVLPHGFNFRWNFAYLDSEFKDSVVVDSRQGAAEVNIKGNKLPNTSKYNLNLVLAQSMDVDWGMVSGFDWSLGMSYRSDFYLSPYNDKGYDSSGNQIDLADMGINSHWLITGAGFDAANGNFLSDNVPDLTIWNMNAGLNFGSEGKYRLEAWVSNLTDETYSTKAFINDSVNIRFLNPPRMSGLRFTAEF